MSALPPRPPFPPPPDSGTLQRYGIRWRGPTEPISEPMPDGYWTPWHLADAEIAGLKALVTDLSDQIEYEIAHEGLNWLPDHACAQCVPDGPLLVEGFVCYRHRASAIAKARAALEDA